MSYEDRWKLNGEEDCVYSKDGYFLNKEECEEYRTLREHHTKTLPTDEALKWDYGKTPKERTRWCGPKKGGEFDSFGECEEKRLLQNLNMFLAQFGTKSGGVVSGARVARRKRVDRDAQTEPQTLVERATQAVEKVEPVQFADTATQVIEDIVADSSSSSELDESRSELDESRAREERMKRDTANLLGTMRPILKKAMEEVEESTKAAERAREKRIDRERRRQASQENLNNARVKTEVARDTLRFKAAVKDETRRRCGEVAKALSECELEREAVKKQYDDLLEILSQCEREAEARRERSVVALRSVLVTVLMTIVYFLTYAKMDYTRRTGLTKLLSVGNDSGLLKDDGSPYAYHHGTRPYP